MSGNLSMSASEMTALFDAVKSYGDGAEQVINSVLHTEAGPMIYQRINPLIHPSGRTFRGHTASARQSDWPRYDIAENLAITVGTKARYRYLYFPDDGSNTERHAGNQQFFYRGGLLAAPDVMERCVAALTKEWSN